MKIVLTDSQTVFDNKVTAEPLNEFGEVKDYGLLRYDEIANAIAKADIVVCNKTLLNEDTLKSAKNLKYIGLFATGYNNIDIEYCSKHVAKYAMPADIQFRDDMPKTLVGKVAYRILEEGELQKYAQGA